MSWIDRPLLLLALAAFVATGCALGASAREQPVAAAHDAVAVPVQVARIERRAPVVPVLGSGVIATRTEVTLSFKTVGVLESISVDEGESVHRGQVLARLDLVEIEAAVRKATAAEAQARRDLERARGLFEDRAATREQLERAETALELTTSDLDVARFNRRRAVIRAPAEGFVIGRLAEAGQTVSPGQPVVTLGARESGWVLRMGVPDRDVLRLEIGDRATIEVVALGESELEGFVREIAEAADPTTGTFETEIEIVGASRLKAGLVARARIEPRSGGLVSVVPVEALVRADGRDGVVYVVDPESLDWRPLEVRVDQLFQDEIAIAGRDGEPPEARWVITAGALGLRPGDRIEIVDRERSGS